MELCLEDTPKKLVYGDISVDQYLDFYERIEKSVMLFATTFDDINDYEVYFKTNYPNVHPVTAEDTIDHEVEHYNIGIKHGLKRITFGLFEVDDEERMHQARKFIKSCA